MCLKPCLGRVEAFLKRLETSPGTPCMLLETAKNNDLAAHILKNHALKAHALTTPFEGVLSVLEIVFEPC